MSESTSAVNGSKPLLTVQNLVVEYPTPGFKSPPFRAVNNVSIQIGYGETLGLVGESGSGKTTLGRALLGLAPITQGAVNFEGTDISHASPRLRRSMSQDLQVVFQDPYTSLNPSMTIGDILSEPLKAHGTAGADARKRVQEVLSAVNMPQDTIDRLPREFSGGQRQRVAIARALALSPKLIVCDEPVSALDLSTQAKVLDLFLKIQRDTGVSYLFISHDLDVVRHLSHRIAVMYHGEIVEQGPAATVTDEPENSYTRHLLLSSPVPDPDRQAERRAMRRKLLDEQAEQESRASVAG